MGGELGAKPQAEAPGNRSRAETLPAQATLTTRLRPPSLAEEPNSRLADEELKEPEAARRSTRSGGTSRTESPGSGVDRRAFESMLRRGAECELPARPKSLATSAALSEAQRSLASRRMRLGATRCGGSPGSSAMRPARACTPTLDMPSISLNDTMVALWFLRSTPKCRWIGNETTNLLTLRERQLQGSKYIYSTVCRVLFRELSYWVATFYSFSEARERRTQNKAGRICSDLTGAAPGTACHVDALDSNDKHATAARWVSAKRSVPSLVSHR